MSDLLTIRGIVRGVGYEASLKPAEWPVLPGREHEWHVYSEGTPEFVIAATRTLGYAEPARAVIEMELERRHARRDARSKPPA